MAVEILIGDCREQLRNLPERSVHCCVTSPPYFGLRDYGHDGQMGLESTPDEFVAGMVAVFREVKRVLRDDGTLWLNLGDSYAGSWGNQGRKEGRGTQRPVNGPIMQNLKPYPDKKTNTGKIVQAGLKPKDRMMVPAMVALALRSDGWWLRDEIVWHKPNAMPSSVTDRTTSAHEMVYMLSKSARYYYDQDAIKEPAVKGYAGSEFHTGKTGEHQQGRSSSKPRGPGNWKTKSVGIIGENVNRGQASGVANNVEFRNRRSVWTVSTKPFKGAHFATFPHDLIEPCILAGCPVGGTVLDPFFGAGTTGLVAKAHGRNAIGIELNHEYATMARARIDAPVVVKKAKKPVADNQNQSDLFANAA